MKKFFEKPTQVAFWDAIEEGYTGGIALGKHIICGRCGETLSINEIIESAPANQIPIYPYSAWVSLDKEIIGDYLPTAEEVATWVAEQKGDK